MEFLTVLGIAFGLAMDAFSVAVASGVILGRVSSRQAFRLSFHFGLFQFGMPILGWALGYLVADQIRAFDHWIAFALLGGIGGKMLWESVRPGGETLWKDPTRGLALIMLSVATSIDAMAIGLTLALIRVPVLFPAVVIGTVAGSLTLAGLHLGKRAGHLLGRRMETLGGAVLICIGFKILMEHLPA